MKRTTWALSLSLFVGGVAIGADAPDTTKLDAQKKELTAKKKELTEKQRDMKAKINASAALAAERKALADAKKALDEKIAADPEVVKAKAAEKEAAQSLAKAVDAKVAASPEKADLSKKIEAMEAKKRDLAYQAALLDIQLGNANSPYVAEVDADPEIQALKKKVAELDDDIEAKPTADVAAARKALAEARAAVAKANQEADIAAASKAVDEAQAALRAALAKDPRQANIAKARQALAEARTKKLAQGAESKSLFEELQQVNAKIAENRKALDLNEDVLEAYAGMIGAEDNDVAQAMSKAQTADKALEDAMKAAGVDKVREEFRAAQKARDEKVEPAAAKEAGYGDLVKKEASLSETVAKLSGRLKELSQAEMEQFVKARAELNQVTRARYGIRRGHWQDASSKPEFEKADALYRALNAKIRENPPVQAAQTAKQSADKALAALRLSKVSQFKPAQGAIQQRAQLSAQRRELAYKQAVLEYKLEGKLSPIAAAVEADAGVTAARKSLDQAEGSPADAAVTSAQGRLKEAQAALKAAHDKSDAWKKASESATAAERAGRDASAKDARRGKLAEAQAAMKAKHAEKLAALPSAKALVDQRKTVATELGEIEKSQQQIKSSLQDLNKKAQGAEDPQLAALRKQIADSQKLVKDAPQDKRFADDQAKIKKADEALSAKLTQLLAADAGYQAAQKDIEAVETKAKEVDDQIKAAKKPAKREKPAAATKPAATKAAKGVAKAATKPSTKPATT